MLAFLCFAEGMDFPPDAPCNLFRLFYSVPYDLFREYDWKKRDWKALCGKLYPYIWATYSHDSDFYPNLIIEDKSAENFYVITTYPIFVLDSNGNVINKIEREDLSFRFVLSGGKVCFYNDKDGKLECYSWNGTLLWSLPDGYYNWVYCKNLDRLVKVEEESGYWVLKFYDTDGNFLKQTTTDISTSEDAYPSFESITVDNDSFVYAINEVGYIFKINADTGTKVWKSSDYVEWVDQPGMIYLHEQGLCLISLYSWAGTSAVLISADTGQITESISGDGVYVHYDPSGFVWKYFHGGYGEGEVLEKYNLDGELVGSYKLAACSLDGFIGCTDHYLFFNFFTCGKGHILRVPKSDLEKVCVK